MDAAVQQAVDNAYRVFARYGLSGGLDVCRCNVCVAPNQERLLTATPLHDIPALTLAEYTNSAHVWNERVADQLRYFLPRYFELIAQDDIPTNLSIETCLARLSFANWRQMWPQTEVAAIERYFAALFRSLLVSPNAEMEEYPGLPSYHSDPAEDLLCMVARAGGDLAPLLAIWDETRCESADLRLANTIGGAEWLRDRLRNSSWHAARRPEVVAAMDQVIAWLRRPFVRERLEAACLAASDPDKAALLSMAEGVVAGTTGRRESSP
jgi:hypothetical protein